MNIPKDWEANPDTEKINVVNGKEVENPEELEVCFIRIMYPPKTRNNLVSVNNTLSIKEGISIYILSNQISLDEYEIVFISDANLKYVPNKIRKILF